MRRHQVIEVLDYDWVPASLRRAALAYLRLALKASGHAQLVVPKLREALERSGQRQVLDLCSGGAGPWPLIGPELQRQGVLDQVLLSDLFPDPGAFADAARDAPALIQGAAEPVDATAVPAGRPGLRTIFNAFHHFPPEVARKVLQDAVDARAPIAIVEVVSREALTLVALLTSPLPVLLAAPFLRPFRWTQLLWAYLLPALPLVVAFDGVMSWLRIYSAPELRELVAGLRDPGYQWDIGLLQLGKAPAHATYLIGYPPGAGRA